MGLCPAAFGQNPPFTIVRYRVDRQPVRIPAYHRFVNSCLKRRSASSSPRVVSTTDLVLLTGSSIKPCLYRRSVDSQSNDFHALQPSCTVRYMSASTASSIFLVSGSTAPDDTSEWVRLGTPEVTGAKTAQWHLSPDDPVVESHHSISGQGRESRRSEGLHPFFVASRSSISENSLYSGDNGCIDLTSAGRRRNLSLPLPPS